ncbi:MAG TPA: HAD family hydrolase [Candidatus Bathyarchaeia archaeon]
MKGIKAVIFDLHGTLLLSDDVDAAWDRWATAFHAELVKRGATMPLKEFKAALGSLYNGSEHIANQPGLTLFERRVKGFCDHLSMEVPHSELRPLVENIIDVWHSGMYLDQDAIPLLEALRRRFKVGLITNWDHGPRMHRLVEQLGLRSLLDDVVVSDDVGVSKPDPRIFRLALSRLGVSASNAVYVGDMDLDARGSLDAGMHSVLVRRGGRGNWASYSEAVDCSYDPEKVTIIERLADLLPLLSGE